MKNISRKNGFTLLELLVVVIIIAVLAAIAVPMYKHAVLKSRFSTVMPMAKALADAQEVYYLGKNMYALEADELDVTPVTAENTTTQLSGERADFSDDYIYVAAQRSDVPNVRYLSYQKHSPKFADTIQCEALLDDEEAVWLCEKGLNGVDMHGSVRSGNYNTYLLAGTSSDSFFSCPANSTCENEQVTGCTGAYYLNEGTCSSCGNGVAACDSSGQATSCQSGYELNKGHCGAAYEGSNTCTSGTDCQYAVFNNSASCIATEVRGCESAVFNDSATCVSNDKYYGCRYSTFNGSTTCTSSIFGGCDGAAFNENSTCESDVEEGCRGGYFKGSSTCKATAKKGCFHAVFYDNAVCDGVGCDQALFYSGNSCCAHESCAGKLINGYPIPKCVKSGNTYVRDGYWD